MLGLFWLSFTIKSLNDREELASTEFPPLPSLHKKVSSVYNLRECKYFTRKRFHDRESHVQELLQHVPKM